jgi:hypothetical protein
MSKWDHVLSIKIHKNKKKAVIVVFLGDCFKTYKYRGIAVICAHIYYRNITYTVYGACNVLLLSYVRIF